MKRIRTAVLGAGWWGTTAHVPALKDHPLADLIAIQHHDQDLAEKVATDFDVPHAFTSAEQLLASEDLDAVVISSTPHLHFPQAKAALERGLHVLVEKPMTHNVEQAQELVNLATEHNVELLVGSTFHYHQHVIETARLVQSGKLGEVIMICVLFMDEVLGLYQGQSWEEFAGNHPDPEVEANPYLKPHPTSYSDPAVSGGGQIFNQVSHAAALVSFVTGDRPVEVYGKVTNAGAPVDVYDALTFQLEKGTTVSLASAGRVGNAPRHFDVRIYGKRGVVELELMQGTMQHWDFATSSTEYPRLTTDEQLYPRFSPATNLVDVALGKASNQSPGSIGLRAMQIIEGACESSRTGRCVAID